MEQLRNMALSIQHWLNRPQKTLVACLLILVMTLFLNGTLWKLWGLYRDQNTIMSQSLETQAQITVIDKQLKQAIDPSYIEHQARDKMDLVGEHDLLFVFPE